MMFSQCTMVYTLRYNIKGSVATEAVPTLFYLSIIKFVSFGPSGLCTHEFNNSHTPENIISKYSKIKQTHWGQGLFLLERLSYTN